MLYLVGVLVGAVISIGVGALILSNEAVNFSRAFIDSLLGRVDDFSNEFLESNNE